MSEPRARARQVDTVLPGLFHWSVHDDRIDYRGDAWAVQAGESLVLVDPEPLEKRALSALGAPGDIVLTIQSHQRAAWRYRRQFGAKVHAPQGAEGLEEEPDAWYADGQVLPGGLRAVHAPGPCEASYALLLDRPEGLVAFTGNLVAEEPRGGLAFVASAYQDAPERTRDSVRRLAAEPIAVLCPGHGAPVPRAGARALAEALERDAGA